MSKAEIEGEEIVIRVPISTIPNAAAYAFDNDMGFEKHNYRVTNAEIFAKELVNSLNSEKENGDTLVTLCMDKAIIQALENGAEGVEP